MVYEDEMKIGISKKERRCAICKHFFWLIFDLFWFINLVDLTMVYLIFNYYANRDASSGGNNIGHFVFDREMQLAIFTACFAVLALIRSILELFNSFIWHFPFIKGVLILGQKTV